MRQEVLLFFFFLPSILIRLKCPCVGCLGGFGESRWHKGKIWLDSLWTSLSSPADFEVVCACVQARVCGVYGGGVLITVLLDQKLILIWFLKRPSNILMEILVIILLGDPGSSKQMLFLLMGLLSRKQIVPINYLKSTGPGLQQNICSFAWAQWYKFTCECCVWIMSVIGFQGYNFSEVGGFLCICALHCEYLATLSESLSTLS